MRHRRHFFQSLATTTLAAGALKAAPSERIHLALIGAGGRGRGLAQAFAGEPDVRVTHICDADQSQAALAIANVEKRQNHRPRLEQDLRRAFDDKSVDAVIIATPDHWHALATIWACQAGKHVYVEKPASHTLWEGKQMVAAARKHDRRVQVGTQSRSLGSYNDMIKSLRDGAIGDVLTAKVWNSQKRPDLPSAADAAVPEGVDYNMWQGPAPDRPFSPNRFHYTWHWHWDYGTGDIGNDGIHDLDVARWGLGATLPTRVACMGHVLENTHWQTPDTMTVVFEFDHPRRVLTFEQRDWSPYLQEGYENGVAFHGTEGYILIGRGGWRLYRGNEPRHAAKESFTDEPHRRNFIDAIKSGVPLNAEIEQGHYSAVLAHLANAAFRAGRCEVKFDPTTQEVLGDSAIQAFTKREYRAPFVVPETV